MSRQSRRSGYVLILTLGILTLAAISLAGLARYSLTVNVEAHEELAELQRRWALSSIRHVVLSRAEELLSAQVPAEQSNAPHWPKPAVISCTFRLSDCTYQAVVADEDAKLNANSILSRAPQRLSELLRNIGMRELAVRPLALKAAPLHSFGQLFDLTRTPNRLGPAATLINASRTITCWGSGRLNLRRASDAAIRAIASLAMSADDVEKLVSLRKSWGGESVEDLLSQLALERPEQATASSLLMCEGHNYSLWVQIDTGQRTQAFQFVEDGGPACFAW